LKHLLFIFITVYRINDYDEQNIDNRCSLSESITQLCSNNNFITQALLIIIITIPIISFIIFKKKKEKDMNSENFFLPSQSLERVELTEENEEKEVYSKEIGVPVKNSSCYYFLYLFIIRNSYCIYL
jgi:hypothetical protein